ncbi:MAG: hypothetical protein FWD17_19655, partial [Polyangiaceae bacterium]|nr:hypothetical protein [Polyangiaceae bacterium]
MMLRSRAPDSTTVLVGLAATAAAACAWQPLDAIVALRAPADASADAAPAADAEQGAAACAPSVTPIQEWTFDASSESWSSALDTGVAASLAWSGAVGQPAAGSIEFDVTPRASDGGSTSGAWVEYDMPIANLAGRTIAAWVMLEAGTSPELKVFAQT